MGEIIDIRSRLRRAQGSGVLYRVRLCAPDLRWAGLVGGSLAGALAAEGYLAVFADLPSTSGSPPVLDLVAGRRSLAGSADRSAPGLLLAAAALPAAALEGCNSRTVLLRRPAGAGRRETAAAPFAGREISLPVNGAELPPLVLAAVFAAGAARLLGVIGAGQGWSRPWTRN